MKIRLYIIIVSLLIVTAFTYGTNYTISNPSIKTTQKVINKNVLCVNISLISKDYIDSLVVNNFSKDKICSQVFIFNPNSKRISVECFYNIKEIDREYLEFIIYKSGKKYQYKNNLIF